MKCQPGPVGQRIMDLSVLVSIANVRRSVICPNFPGFDRPRPAAFVIRMPGSALYRMMLSGLYLYRPALRRIATP